MCHYHSKQKPSEMHLCENLETKMRIPEPQMLELLRRFEAESILEKLSLVPFSLVSTQQSGTVRFGPVF